MHTPSRTHERLEHPGRSRRGPFVFLAREILPGKVSQNCTLEGSSTALPGDLTTCSYLTCHVHRNVYFPAPANASHPYSQRSIPITRALMRVVQRFQGRQPLLFRASQAPRLLEGRNPPL